MSIITTVYIPEGIIMAADSRLTGVNTYPDGKIERLTISDNSQKLFLIKKVNVGISCCGDAIIAGKSVADFLRIFEINQVDESDSVEQVSTKLRDFTMKEHGSGVIYHVVGYNKDIPYVFVVANDILQRQNIRNNTNDIDYGFMWNGEQEALNKLVNGEPRMQFNFNLMQLKDGIDLAEFLVDLTIKYQRFDIRLATCGGTIDVLVVTKDYCKFIKHKVLNP